MTLNGITAFALRYFTEFGKPVFQHVTASIWAEFMHVYDVVLRKFTFVISSPDEFFVVYGYIYAYIILFFNIVASETSKKTVSYYTDGQQMVIRCVAKKAVSLFAILH